MPFDPSLTWTLHGFQLRVLGVDPGSPIRTLGLLYALCTPALFAALIEPAFAPLMLTFLFPLPTALAWHLFRPRETVIEVDHKRLVVQDGFGIRRTVPLRAIRRVGLRLDGFELELASGRRQAVHAPAGIQKLTWVAARLGELCAEVRAFDAQGDGQRDDVERVMAMARRSRRAASADEG